MYMFINIKEVKSVKISESVTPKYFLYIFTQVGGGSVRSRGTATTSQPSPRKTLEKSCTSAKIIGKTTVKQGLAGIIMRRN